MASGVFGTTDRNVVLSTLWAARVGLVGMRWGVMLFAACTSSGPAVAHGCRTGVAVGVSAGTTPIFTWSPECLMSEVVVTRASDDQSMWRLGHSTAPVDEVIHPPLAYGATQPGVISTTPLDLETGTEYVVFVFSYDLLNGGSQLQGEANFTP